jgi:hypothetical protein
MYPAPDPKQGQERSIQYIFSRMRRSWLRGRERTLWNYSYACSD